MAFPVLKARLPLERWTCPTCCQIRTRKSLVIGAHSEIIEHEQPNRRRKVVTGTVDVDPLDQRIDCNIFVTRDLPQAIPELVFQGDGRLISREPDRALKHGRI
jgi:hypothetical protein